MHHRNSCLQCVRRKNWTFCVSYFLMCKSSLLASDIDAFRMFSVRKRCQCANTFTRLTDAPIYLSVLETFEHLTKPLSYSSVNITNQMFRLAKAERIYIQTSLRLTRVLSFSWWQRRPKIVCHCLWKPSSTCYIIVYITSINVGTSDFVSQSQLTTLEFLLSDPIHYMRDLKLWVVMNRMMLWFITTIMLIATIMIIVVIEMQTFLNVLARN